MLSYFLSRAGIFCITKCDATPQKPTHYEYAVMCQQTYKKNGGAPSPDWTVIHSRDHENEMGFAAITYKNDKKKSIVIAFRGSQNIWNWVATNPFLPFSQLPSTFGYAEIHTKESIKRAPKGYHISTTGHSLGAVISEIIACRFRIPAVTFESAGSKHMIEADKNRSQSLDEADITTYLAAPNPVNTLNSQSAQATEKLFRLYIPHLSEEDRNFRKFIALSKFFLYTNPIYYINPIYWLYGDLEKILYKGIDIFDSPSWVLRQHDIDNIVNQFDPKTGDVIKCDRIISWPSMLSNTTMSAIFLLLKRAHPFDILSSQEMMIEASISLIPGYKVENYTMDLRLPKP